MDEKLGELLQSDGKSEKVNKNPLLNKKKTGTCSKHIPYNYNAFVYFYFSNVVNS